MTSSYINLKAYVRNPELNSFNGSMETKDRIVEKSDAIVAAAATLNKLNGALEVEFNENLNIPHTVRAVYDAIAMHLSSEVRPGFTNEVVRRIAVGKDLTRVWLEFALFLMRDVAQGNANHPILIDIQEDLLKELRGTPVNWLKITETFTDIVYRLEHPKYDGRDFFEPKDLPQVLLTSEIAKACSVSASYAYTVTVKCQHNKDAIESQAETFLELLSQSKFY